MRRAATGFEEVGLCACSSMAVFGDTTLGFCLGALPNGNVYFLNVYDVFSVDPATGATAYMASIPPNYYR